MATQTATLRLSKPTIGGDGSNVWPADLNLDMDLVDRAINQTVTVSVSDTNVSLTADGTASDQALYAIYNITGAWTADRTITLPANVKIGYCINGTTGGHNVVLSAGGTTLSIAPGATIMFRCDGSNVVPFLPGWQTLATYSPSGAAQQTCSLNTAYRRFRLTLQGITVSTNTAFLGLRFSSDGGSTFLSSGYNYALASVDTSSGVGTFSTSTSASSITLSPTLVAPASGNIWDAVFDIHPGSASVLPRVTGRGYGVNNSNNYQETSFGGGWNGSLALMNFAEVIVSAGTFSGTVILEGLL